jgi:hypothetical protein
MATVALKTKAGLTITANRIKGSGTEPKYLGWGTGTTAATINDTGLETAAAESRTEGTSSIVTTDNTDDTYRVSATLTCAGAGKTISEVALFDASTAGNCFARVTFDGIALEVGESIAFTISDKHIPVS